MVSSARKRRRSRVSYAWALHVEPERKAEHGSGLAYARELALDARERSRAALRGEQWQPLTPEWQGERDGISATTVRRRIRETRYAYYGNLSTSGIYAQRRRERAREHDDGDGPRRCAAPDCRNRLPFGATKRRAYCHPRCRRRHHYQRHAWPDGPPPTPETVDGAAKRRPGRPRLDPARTRAELLPELADLDPATRARVIEVIFNYRAPD
jgi:hypothetical protein